jgi:hypothetical protein
MRTISFAHKDTGLFNGSTVTTTSDDWLAINTPPDHIAIEGRHDHLSTRVDLSVAPEIINNAGKVGYHVDEAPRTVHKVIDYQPPAPSSEHQWNADTKRWQLSAAAADKINRSNVARARIAELEASQPRHIRGIALGKPGAKEALQSIDDEIAALEAEHGA